MVIAFTRLIYNSLSMVVRGNNTRARSDAKSQAWGRQMMHAVNARYELKGELPNFKDGRPYMIISNHLSHFDIPAVFATVPASVRMVAKKELYSIPLFAGAMRRHEFVCIDRSKRAQAVKDLAKAREAMQSGIVIWIAAEGTRSRTGKLQAFKKGVFMLAIDAQAVIVPMIIEGTNRILPPDTLDVSTGQKVTVTLGPCVDTTGMTVADRDTLMSTVRNLMEEMSHAS
jgi:1-acyl-sn-glycerol-3-phosphate acyltransferase